MKVCTCWDDAPVNDIRLTKLFRRYGVKATFNLNPGIMDPETRGMNKWMPTKSIRWTYNGFSSGRLALKDVAEIYEGFELASHCWKHEVPGTVSDGEWIQSALDARHFCEDITGKPCRGFAWPCGRFTPETVALLRAHDFAYGRTTANVPDVTQCTEPLALPSNCHFMARDFWERYEAARPSGVFYFWGHSYEMYEYDPLWHQLEYKLAALAEDPDVEWINVVDLVPLLAASPEK